MVAASRTKDTALVAGDVKARLWNEPYAFQFFQAVRLLENLYRNRKQVGRFAAPADEIARFSVNTSLSFPSGDIHTLMPRDAGPPLMTVNFMQLLGAHGVLPRSYTELVLSQAAAKQTALRDFLDLFQHRLVSLFYQAWRKYRVLESESHRANSLSTVVQHLIGLGTEGLRNRQPVLDESLGFYAGLIVQQPHSPTALQLLLSDYFDVPVQIEQFIGAWYDLDTASQCNLGGSGEDRRQLGLGAVVGDQVWEVRAKARIVLGPLSRRQYLDFLPSGSAYAPLKALARFFSDEVDFEAQLVLASEEAPACTLGAVGETAPKLGWVSWVKTRPMDRNPADTIIPL